MFIEANLHAETNHKESSDSKYYKFRTKLKHIPCMTIPFMIFL